MSRPITARPRQLATELEQRFVRDAELARALNEAHRRLQGANDRLWWGLHPDGIAVVYEQHPAAVDAAFAENRSEVLGVPDPLQAIKQTHWQIHKAHHDYQNAAERRRQLAAEIGELSRELVTTLVGAGWSERDAREAGVHDLAISRTYARQSPWRTDGREQG